MSLYRKENEIDPEVLKYIEFNIEECKNIKESQLSHDVIVTSYLLNNVFLLLE